MRSDEASGASNGSPRSQSRHLMVVGTVAIVATSTLLLGTVHAPARAAVAVLLAALVVAGGAGRRPGLLVGMGAAGLGLLCMSAVALIPVSAELRASLQPGLASTVNAGLDALGAPARPLALAPEAARATLGWMGIVLAAGGPIALIGRTRTRRVHVAAGLLGVCAGVSVLGILHRVLGLEQIYGVSGFPLGAVRELFFAPFINPNHGGLLCALGVPLALGIGVRRDPAQTGALCLAALACVGGAVVSGSRGAVAAAGVGVGVFLLASGSRLVVASVLSAVGLAGGLIVARGTEGAVATLTALVMPGAATPHALGQRPTLWMDTLDMLSAAPWVGVGPAGFAAAWPLFDQDPRYSNAGHAHQEVLQTLAEHGWLVGGGWVLLALVPVGVGVAHACGLRRGRRRRLTAGLLGAMAGILVACLFGFPLRIGALALVYTVLAATILGAAAQTARPVGRGLERLARGGEGGLAVLGAALVAFSAVGDTARSEPSDQLDALERQLLARPLWTQGWLARADLHLAARELDACADDLEQAIATWPGSPWPRMAKAELAHRVGDAAGARRAWRAVLSLNLPDNDRAEPWLERAVANEPDPALALLDLVPNRADRLRDAGHVAEDLGDPLVAEMLYQRAFALDSSVGLPLVRHQLQQGLPRAALATLGNMPPAVVASCRGQISLSRALLATGDTSASVEAAESAQQRCEAGNGAARTALVRAQVARGDRSAIDKLEGLAKASPDDHALRRELLAGLRRIGAIERLEEHLGHLAAAGVATPEELEALRRVREGLLPR